ncbi:MAG: geranylgeranyl reductase family protein [Candidatus Hodarchaeales archaeon]|jgi:geranylgeranyl reductase family protein
MNVDVLVVGLGPAGASVLDNLTKIASKNLSILGIDKRDRPGFPVQCGEFMPSPEEMAILTPNVTDAHSFYKFDSKYISSRTNRISFHSPEGKIIQTPFEGYTLHRGDWNEDLLNSAEQAGAQIWRSSRAVNKVKDSVWISRKGSSPEPIKARIIVGADGARSRIARWSGLSEKRNTEHFVYVKQHVMTKIDSPKYDPSDIQMFFGKNYAPGAYAWVIPKNENTANVGVGLRTPMSKGRITVSKSLENFTTNHPYVSELLKSATIKSTIGGLVPVGLPLKKTVDERSSTILVGDSACQVVSSVGGGIPTSMVAGSIAAETIHKYLSGNGSLTDYQTKWRKDLMTMFERAYKLRRLFDRISSGSDSRVQWYLNRLKSSDVNDVVHCRVPLKVSLAFPFINYLNFLIK